MKTVSRDWQTGEVSFFGTSLLITGPESMLAERAVEQRRDAALKEYPDAEVHKINAAELAETPLGEVVGGSLFATHIVAIIDDVGSCPPDVVDQLAEAAGLVGPETCLILVHHGGMKGKKLLDSLKKRGVERVEAKAVKAWDAWRFVVDEAKRAGLRVQRETAEVLVDAVGSDLRALAGAVAQLASDADNGVIDETLIRRYFAGRAEVSGFKVADSLLAANPTQTLEHLRWALDTGVAPVLIVAAVANNLRGMGKYLDAQSSRMSPGELASHMGVPPFKIRTFNSNSRFWSTNAIAQGIQLASKADADVKGAATDPEHALESMVLGILALRNR